MASPSTSHRPASPSANGLRQDPMAHHHHVRSNPWQSVWEMLLVIAVLFAAAYGLWQLGGG